MPAIARTSSTPLKELSLQRPTKGEIYVAPAFAAMIACATENTRVTFVLIPRTESDLHAINPSTVQGTLIVIASLPSAINCCACSIISSAVSATTSQETLSNCGYLVVSSSATSGRVLPLRLISVGLVVTPSTRPVRAAFLISSRSAVSRKIFIVLI